MVDKFGESSFFPSLEQPIQYDQEIYRFNRTNEVLKELKKEKNHYESVYKIYKKLHKTMYIGQLLINSTSVASGAGTAGTLITGAGIFASIPLGLVSMITGGFGIVLGIFDQKALKKMKKHSKIVQLVHSVDSNIIRKYLSDQKINKDEFNEILKLIEKYYSTKEEIRSKSRH